MITLQMMQRIYVLQCEHGKFYVGRTSNIERRFAEHLDGRFGSEWTRYYAPQCLIEVEDMKSEFDEMTKTLEYMKRFGIDHVRSAHWSNVSLTAKQREEINRAMNTNGCFDCGQIGHFANNCPNRNQSFPTERIVQCFRCGNDGHYANECYGTKYCKRCGSHSHFENQCYARYDIDGNRLACDRCGRYSHSVEECYAGVDFNGNRLH